MTNRYLYKPLKMDIKKAAFQMRLTLKEPHPNYIFN